MAIVILQMLKFWKNRHSSQFQENLWNNPKVRAHVEKEVDHIALAAPQKEPKKTANMEKTQETPRFQKPNFLGAPHEVLGVTKEAPKEEINAAYRYWIKRYHPDRIAHLGALYIKQANQRTEALNKARALLLSKFS